MTDRVQPGGINTAGITHEVGEVFGKTGTGWIVPATDATISATLDTSIDETALAAFTASSNGLDVTISAGEAFVNGWLARDVSTVVTLAANTSDQTVYLGWRVGAVDSDQVIIGLAADFDSDDFKVPIWEFDTDATSVTSSTDLRVLGDTANEDSVEPASLSDNIGTDDIPEDGNLYFTNERAQDAAAALIQGGNDVSVTYNDALNELIISADTLTQENVDDFVAALMNGGGGINISYNDSQNELTISHANTSSVGTVNTSGLTIIDGVAFDTYGHVTSHATRNISEEVRDVIAAMMREGTDIEMSYNDSQNEFTISHGDSSTQGDVIQSAGRVIESLVFDGRGHVTNVDTRQMDHDYLTGVGKEKHHELPMARNDDLSDITVFRKEYGGGGSVLSFSGTSGYVLGGTVTNNSTNNPLRLNIQVDGGPTFTIPGVRVPDNSALFANVPPLEFDNSVSIWLSNISGSNTSWTVFTRP